MPSAATTSQHVIVVPDREPKLEWWTREAQGSLALRSTLTLASKVMRAAVLPHEKQLFVAWVDERAHAMLARLTSEKLESPHSLAEGVDRRFPPALASVGEKLLLAFTRSVGEAMHVHLAQVNGEHSTMEDVTPQGHGASAPTFVVGASPASLIMVDAHAGVSPLLEVSFDARAKAQVAVVRTPVSQPYVPPALAAVQVSSTRTVVAFTAIGRAAATAIGLVPLEKAEAPTALLSSYGYGELSLSASKAGELAVFAVEAFREDKKDAARKVVVSVVDEKGAGPPLELGADAEDASAPSVQAGPKAGEFRVVYSTPKGVRLADLVCAP